MEPVKQQSPPERWKHSRWDYVDDRRILERWLVAKRPCKALDWRMREDDQTLVIKVEPSGPWRRWYNVPMIELRMAIAGWRWVIAQAIKKCRQDIRLERLSAAATQLT